jgi:hypothetical protein
MTGALHASGKGVTERTLQSEVAASPARRLLAQELEKGQSRCAPAGCAAGVAVGCERRCNEFAFKPLFLRKSRSQGAGPAAATIRADRRDLKALLRKTIGRRAHQPRPYRGQVALVVNVAAQRFHEHYAELQKLYESQHARGFACSNSGNDFRKEPERTRRSASLLGEFG